MELLVIIIVCNSFKVSHMNCLQMVHELPLFEKLTSTMGTAVRDVHAMNLPQMIDQIGLAGVLLVAQIALAVFQPLVDNFDVVF